MMWTSGDRQFDFQGAKPQVRGQVPGQGQAPVGRSQGWEQPGACRLRGENPRPKRKAHMKYRFGLRPPFVFLGPRLFPFCADFPGPNATMLFCALYWKAARSAKVQREALSPCLRQGKLALRRRFCGLSQGCAKCVRFNRTLEEGSKFKH